MKIDLKSAAAGFIIADNTSRICANGIIMKAISNAFKHGKTTRATVEFQISEPGFVEIVIENNGVGLPPKNKPGLGSELIDEIAHPWTRQNKSVGGVILTARLPVSRKRHKG